MKKTGILEPIYTKALVVLLFVGGAVSSQASELSDGLSSVPLAEIRQELEALPEDVRAGMNREQMTRFISNVLIDRRMAEAAAAAGIPNRPSVRAAIARAGRNVVVKAYVDSETSKFAETLPNLENLAQERYKANKASYVIPEAIRVAHILFRVNAEDAEYSDKVVRPKAEQVLTRIRNGEDFGELAREFSDDPGSAKRNGELPWSDKGKLVPPFEDAAYSLKPGEVSGLVLTRFGYHIIKLLEKRDARQKPFEEVKGQLVIELRNEFLGRKRAEWTKTFQGDKPIVLDDATLEMLKKP